jgi:hypothetical protein
MRVTNEGRSPLPIGGGADVTSYRLTDITTAPTPCTRSRAPTTVRNQPPG